MKEITKTITKRYDAEGKLIEHSEVTQEKETKQDTNYLQQPTVKPWWMQQLY